MAGILRVDTLESDSNLALKIATANVAFIDFNGLNVVGGNLTIGATQFAEGGQIQTAGIADDAITSDKILSVANTKISGLIQAAQIGSANASVINAGTLAGARLPAGSVLQVVSTTKSDYFTATSNGGNWADITNFSVSITPSSASSKILVFANVQGHSDGNMHFRLVRGSTPIGVGDAAENRAQATAGDGFNPDDNNNQMYPMHFLDSPNTTSSTTYKVQFVLEAVGKNGAINGTVPNSNVFTRPRFASMITVMEIAG